MISEKLKVLSKFINKDDTVLDVGTDHGYLCIYLKKNKLCKKVYASDISKNAINMAQKNFLKHDMQIETFVSDGFNNIPVAIDTAVIAGMGTSTIIKIINNKKCPSKLILSSNNDFYKLRLYLHNNEFQINDELIIKENNHYYVILNCERGRQKLTEEELQFGLSNNMDYFKYLYDKNKKIIQEVPQNKKEELLLDNKKLKEFIEKKWGYCDFD